MLSIPHLIIIFAVALVVFGPQKLPELARNLGKMMADFRRMTGDLQSTFNDHMRELEREAQAQEQQKRAAALPASPATPPPAAENTIAAERPTRAAGTEPTDPLAGTSPDGDAKPA